MIRKNRKYALVAVLILFVVLFIQRYEVAEWVRNMTGFELPIDPRPAGLSDMQWCEKNYKDEVAELAKNYQVSYPYLMALIVLECGGDKPAGHRYEKHIFKKLERLKEGKIKKFENIAAEDLVPLDKEGLENLSTSWGPFQLMGYKAIPLGVSVADLRSEKTATEISVRWIKQEYGHFIAKKKWKDAFHYHNTGQRFPLSGRSKTHNPYYVSDGIKYMKYFAQHDPTNPAVSTQP